MNKTTFRYVYQFKISLNNISPLVWRRIQVPETYTFWDFHVAIQDSMGWLDYHLHQFETKNPKTGAKEIIGIPEKIYGEIPYDVPTQPGWKLFIRDYFSEEYRSMPYLYDFGDSWHHLIEYECILFKRKKQKYPICLAGERSCPPEDCGGSYGYKDLLEILKSPDDERYSDMKTWVGRKFDSEHFDPSKVKFDNPHIRWRKAFIDQC